MCPSAHGSAGNETAPWPLLFQRGDLLPQRQVLDQELLARAKDGSEGTHAEGHEEHEETEHDDGVCLAHPAISSPPLGTSSRLALESKRLILLEDE